MLTETLNTGGGNIPAFQKMDNSDSKTKGNGKVKTSIAAAVVAEAESFFSDAGQSKKIQHVDVLGEILENLSEIDFHEVGQIPKDVNLNQTHYRVLTVREVLRVAKELKCGLCRNQDFFYVFNGESWQMIERDKLEMFLGKAAAKLGVNGITAEDCEFRAKLFKQFTTTATLPTPEQNSDKVLINLKNGTFEIDRRGNFKLRGFERKDFLTYQLPFEYDAAAACPKWLKFLGEILPDVTLQNLLAEYFGYVFTKNLKLEKALFCYGGGSNGKSVAFDVINAVLGKDNVSNYSLESLNENYFRAMLGNKLLNYSSEISTRLESQRFKQLTSGEPVEARLPYGQPMILTNYAKLAFNCNELPKDVEHTNGFFRRFLIIPFNVTIEEKNRNPNLSKEIIETELSGVFNWILSGLKRLIVQGDFSQSDAVKNMVDSFRRESDSVAMFLNDENYIASEFCKRKVAEIYSEYKHYCTENLYRALGRNKFCKRLESNGIPRNDSFQPFFMIEKRESE